MKSSSTSVVQCFAVALLSTLLGCALSAPDKPWHQPCRDGNTAELRKQIAAGLDPNGRDVNGSTPIFYALVFERWETADYLLSVGARLGSENNRSYTVIEAVRKTAPSIDIDAWLKKHDSDKPQHEQDEQK
jgi:ankyrin repeat protein